MQQPVQLRGWLPKVSQVKARIEIYDDDVQTSTDYGPYLANEPSPLHTTTIVDRCTEKLVDDWNKMRTNVRLLPYHM